MRKIEARVSIITSDRKLYILIGGGNLIFLVAQRHNLKLILKLI